jgi:hypothetical protein
MLRVGAIVGECLRRPHFSLAFKPKAENPSIAAASAVIAVGVATSGPGVARRRAHPRSAPHYAMSTRRVMGDALVSCSGQPCWRWSPQPVLLVAPGSEPVKAAPAGPPASGPDGLSLTGPPLPLKGHLGRQGGPCRPDSDYQRWTADAKPAHHPQHPAGCVRSRAVRVLHRRRADTDGGRPAPDAKAAPGQLLGVVPSWLFALSCG